MTDGQYRFVHAGKEISPEEAAKQGFIAIGYGPDQGVAETFESHAAFVKWAQGTDHGPRVSEAFRRMEIAKRRENTDTTEIEARQRGEIERLRRELEALAERSGLEIGSEELFRRATEAEADPLEGPVFGSALLWAGHGFTGGLLPIPGSWFLPDFRWFNFDDIASSGYVFGDVVLFEFPWFGGQGIDFRSGALPPISYDSLPFELFGFWDNRLSSGFSFFW